MPWSPESLDLNTTSAKCEIASVVEREIVLDKFVVTKKIEDAIMETPVGAVFGASIALILLLIYSIATFSFILAMMGSCKGDSCAKITEDYEGGYTYVVTTVGGLVSALVIA